LDISCCMHARDGNFIYEGLDGKPEGKRPLRRPGLDGKIILECTLEK